MTSFFSHFIFSDSRHFSSILSDDNDDDKENLIEPAVAPEILDHETECLPQPEIHSETQSVHASRPILRWTDERLGEQVKTSLQCFYLFFPIEYMDFFHGLTNANGMEMRKPPDITKD
jgi:hypothetical protein